MQLGRLIIDIAGTELTNEDIDLLKHPYVGGIILFSRNFNSINQIKELIGKIKLLRSPSLITYIDHEGGRVQRFKEGMTLLPSISLLGEKYITEPDNALFLAKELGWLTSFELTSIGIDVNTSPVLDINYKRSNIMSERCFSEKPNIVSLLAESFILGSKESCISSICKHYPGHGFARTDSHVELPVDNRDIKKSDEQEEKQVLDELEWPSIIDKTDESIKTKSNSLTEVEKINNNQKYDESTSNTDDFSMPDL